MTVVQGYALWVVLVLLYLWWITKGRDETPVESISLVEDTATPTKTLPETPSEDRQSQTVTVVTFQKRQKTLRTSTDVRATTNLPTALGD